MFENIITKLEETQILSKEEYILLIKNRDNCSDFAAERARAVREKIYGKDVYIRGLIEFSNICKNDCYYCGIRHSNKNAQRYRLTKEQILSCCKEGYRLGFRTFVLQGGEDPYFTDQIMCDIVKSIRELFNDCAITLSLGERSYESYKALKAAGANRYLLRHETATKCHYEKLHPENLSFENRINCLKNLKKLGFQTGAGFMVGSPYQSEENIANDILFLKKLQPQMVGIGPFIPQHDTPFANKTAGTAQLTKFILSLIRLTLPNVLLPATTALGTIQNDGREQGILAGANVVMPNLSPTNVRNKYTLYDNKICTGDEAAQCIECLKNRMSKIGYNIVCDRGDYKEQKI